MHSIPINQYGDLCTELYERLHPVAEAEELDFYLSYARPKHRILEPLCGSGRFLIPFSCSVGFRSAAWTPLAPCWIACGARHLKPM